MLVCHRRALRSVCIAPLPIAPLRKTDTLEARNGRDLYNQAPDQKRQAPGQQLDGMMPQKPRFDMPSKTRYLPNRRSSLFSCQELPLALLRRCVPQSLARFARTDLPVGPESTPITAAWPIDKTHTPARNQSLGHVQPTTSHDTPDTSPVSTVASAGLRALIVNDPGAPGVRPSANSAPSAVEAFAAECVR